MQGNILQRMAAMAGVGSHWFVPDGIGLSEILKAANRALSPTTPQAIHPHPADQPCQHPGCYVLRVRYQRTKVRP